MELTQRIKERLREVEDWGAVVDQLEADAVAVAEKLAQSVAYFDLARACEDIFLDKARAMQCYQRAFKLDQSNLSALRHARLIYQEMGSLEMVSRLMAIELKANRDASLAASLNYAFGTTQLNLRDIDKAKSFLEAASSGEASNEVYRARFQETLYDRANWQGGLNNVYDQLKALTGQEDPLAAKVKGKGEPLSSLYLRAARILQQEAPEDPRLLPLLFKSLDANPSNDEAGFVAESLLAQAGQIQVIQKLHDRRASMIQDERGRIEMLRYFANIWNVRLNNLDMAAYFYYQALELVYGSDAYFAQSNQSVMWHVAAFRTLVQQAETTGQADALVPLAQRGLEVIRDANERGLVALLAAQIAWRKFDDVDTARTLLGHAIEHAPNHPLIVDFQKQVGPVAPPQRVPAKGPAPTAGELQDDDGAVRERPREVSEPAVAAAPVAEVPADVAPPTATDEPETIGQESFSAEEMRIINQARNAERGGGKRAIDTWRDAMAKLPERDYPRERLKQLYAEGNKWSNVADLIKDEIKRIPDEDVVRKEALYWELTELYRDRLRQPGLVVTSLAALEKVLEAVPEQQRLLRVVEAQQAQFETMKRWPDLIGRIRRRAELTEEPEAQKTLHLQAGTLFLEKFNNQAEAIKSFESVLEIDAYEPTAIGHLKELYGRRRDWEKMLGVQQKELALIQDAVERKERLLEVARTAGTKIKRASISIELWTQVLDLDPDNVEALENLEQLLEREKDWPALARTLDRLAETTLDGDKRGQHLIKLGVLYSDKLNDNRSAIRAWESLHEIDPGNRRAQDALKKLYLSEGNMDALEAFYAKQDKWSEFIRVLEREADSASPEQKTALLLKIADLYRDKLDKPDRAIRALERALEDAAGNLTVAERLIDLYEQSGDERHIAVPLKIKLDHEDDAAVRQGLLRRLADLAERVANDPVVAFEYYRRALDEDHTGADVRGHLERLAEASRSYDALARALEGAIAKYGADSDSLPLRLKLAKVHEEHLADLDAALRTNQAILDIDPEQATALASLERLFLALGREEDLLEVLTTKLSLAGDDAERRATLTRIGSLHEQLGHADKAIEAYEGVLAGGMDEPIVLGALDRIYSSLVRREELAGIVARELALVPEHDVPARTGFLIRLGNLKQELAAPAGEAIQLYHQVLELDPSHDEARARLEGWLDDDAHKLEVASILLPIYETSGAHAQQVRCLEIQAAAEEGSARVELLLRAGSILADAMGDSRRAFDCYARAFTDDPQNEVAQRQLERIAAVDNRWPDFVDLYENAVSRDLPSELMRQLLTKLARLYDAQLGQPQKAIQCFERAVDIDPSDRASLDALEALYSRDENWSQLLGVYRSKVEIETDPQLREDLRFKIASLQEDLLGSRADAIATYNEILADDETNLRAIQALDRLYRGSEQWHELAENLARQLSLADDSDQQIGLNLRLGQLRREKLDQTGLAVESFSRALELEPGNPIAMAALEQLLGDPEHQLAVARILEEIYKASSDWPKLISVYDIRVKHSLDPNEKIQLLHQIGQLHELAGGKPEEVFAAFGRAFEENPANEDTQNRLEKLATQMGHHAGLVALYERVVGDSVDDVLRTLLLFKVARTYEESLSDPIQAAKTYEKVLDIDPANFDAVDALIEVHRQNNQFDSLVAAVKRKAEMVESPEDQKALLKYAAAIREDVMSDAKGAIELFQQVLTTDDTDREALEALVRLYLKEGRWDQLKDVYQRQSELAEDPDDRRKALYVLGQVYDAELGETDRAIDTYQAVLEIDAADYQAIQALDRLYGQAERWLDQLQILERAVEAVPDELDQTGFRYRIGALWETKLGDIVRSIESYREVLAYDPSHVPTITALERIVHGESEPMQAAEVLAPLYEHSGEWDKLVEIYEVMIAHTEDPIAKIERLHRTALLHESQLSAFDRAFDAYARAFATDPQSEETVEQLERLAEITNGWQAFADLLAAQADKLLDPQVKIQVLLRLARIYEERLHNVDKAVSRYREILDADPDHREAVGSLERIFTVLERWPELVENLRRQVTMTGSEVDVVGLYFRIGQIHQLKTGETDRALEAYREVLNLDPAHPETLRALEAQLEQGRRQSDVAEILEPIYQAAGRWDALVKLGEVKLSVTDDPVDRLTIIQNLADIAEHKLGAPHEAYVWWLRAYMDNPTSEQVFEELERLAEQTDQWAHIVGVGEQILDTSPAPEVKLAVLGRSARVLDEQLRDAGRAIEVYRQVLEIDPENGPALIALDRIYSYLGMAEDLVEVLQRRIRFTVDEGQVDLLVRLAQVYEGQLGNAELAISAYMRALESDPTSEIALQRLEALYLSQFKWQDLFDIYQKMVDVANTDEDSAGCYQRMAKLASETLQRPDDAVDLWTKVLDLRGEDAVALGELATLHEQAQRWEELVEVLERRVFVSEDSVEQKVAAYQMLGRVYGEHLERERNALDAWNAALDLAPTNLETLEALHDIYEKGQAWPELTEVLSKLIAVGPGILGSERILALHAKLGRIQAEYLMQPDEAIGHWLRVLEFAPDNVEALAALEEQYTQQGRFNDTIEILERKADLLEGDEKIDVLMQIASIWEDRLEDRQQAAAAYDRVRELAPGHGAAADALEHIYRETEDWPSLAMLLLDRAERSTEIETKVPFYHAAAKVLEQELHESEEAFNALLLAFHVDYANDHTARELERLATENNKWSILLSEYNGKVEEIEDPLEQCELWVKIGRSYGEHLGHTEYAVWGPRSLQRALELNPQSVSALHELAKFQRRDGNFDELARTLARVIPLEQEPDEQNRTLLELGQVREVHLSDVDGAVESYRRVLEIDAESTAALDSLIRLHEKQGAWIELVRVLGRRSAATVEHEERLQIQKHIGYVQEANLGDMAAAIETYKDILAQEPTDLDALQSLERLHLNANQIDDYLEILESELDATAEVPAQIAIYDKMANALVSLADDRERAAEVLQKVLLLDPNRDLTYRQLEELYSGLEKWSELLETYRSHVEATEDPTVKVELLSAMGEIFERHVQDNERAIETYKEILELDGDNFGAATTLSRLQETLEDWPKAIETMGRLVDLHPDPTARLELLTRMGRVLHEKIMDSEEAEVRLNQALTFDPGYVPALVLLADIHRGRGDWLKASRTLETASEYSSNTLERTKLASEAAFINYEQLDDRNRAIDLFARTLQYDPEHVAVGRVLADIYIEGQHYSAADPILDMLTRKVEQLELDDDAQRDLFMRAAQVARALGNGEKALKQYKRAYDIDSTNHDVLVGMGDLLFEREDWERAFKLYQTILVQHRDTQADEDTVRVYHRLGTIKNRQGEPRKALNYFEKALEVDPHHEETLAAVIQLRAQANDWEGVIEAKRALVDITPDGDQQFALWKDIGQLYAEQLGNRDKAADSYQAALDIKPEDFPTLHTLLDLYTAAKRWEDAISVIDRIVDIETAPSRRSRYNYTAAVLLRDEMESIDDAIDRFNAVLDDDVTMLKAFQAIDTLLTKAKDWKALERAYRKMLKRMPADGNEPLKVTLWNNLAEIYRSRLQDFKSAVAAYEVASKLEPGNVARHIKMAELYERLMQVEPDEHLEAAVREHQILIASEPFRYESYHSLYNIYLNASQIDKAYCLGSVLAFLKKATPEEEKFVSEYRKSDFQRARQRLSEDTLRRNVFHPDQDLYLTGILGLIAPAVAAWRAQEVPNTLNIREIVDISIDPSLFSRTAKYIRDVLNVSQPDVYLRPSEPGDIALLNLKRDEVIHPSLVVFQNLLRQTNESHLAFSLARHMMDLYLPHFCFVALDRLAPNLKQVFMACLRAVGMPVPGDTAELDQIAAEITRRMQPAAFDQLRKLIQKFVETGGSIDVKRWSAAAELTTYRVGLLLCNDLRVAGQMISQEQSMLGSAMGRRDKIKELVLYSISEDYFTARRALGLHVG